MDFCYNQESPALIIQNENVIPNLILQHIQLQPSTFNENQALEQNNANDIVPEPGQPSTSTSAEDQEQQTALDLNKTFGRPNIDLNEPPPTS